MSLTNKKSFNYARLSGILIIGIIWIVAILISILVIFEYFGFANKVMNKITENKSSSYFIEKSLKDNLYYGKNYNSIIDPYEKFKEQYLHPYYLFSLPWKETDQEKIANNVVTLNKDGFRISGINGKPDALFLGGSTAFGHYSSSNENTIAWILSEKTKYSFANLNAPSWNSHQELIALLKYRKNNKLSVSLSLANDIEIYCSIYDIKFVDQQENFPALLEMSTNEKSIITIIYLKFKSKIKNYFPNSFFIFKTIRRNISFNKYNKNNPNQNLSKIGSCENDYDASTIAESFIFNQSNMMKISKSRGGNHITLLQPHIDLLKDGPNFRKKVYAEVLKSSYCNKYCYNLSNFSNNNNLEEVLYNGKNLNTALFIDRVHLSDSGVKLISQKIIEILQ